MTPPANPERYKNHRFPGESIRHGVWLSSRFTLSDRDVQELLLERGITVSHEAIRKWCGKFGPDYANRLRRRRPRPGDKWHWDEVFITINKQRHYLGRAVDQDGTLRDILVQRRRNTQAAKKCFRKLLQGLTYVNHQPHCQYPYKSTGTGCRNCFGWSPDQSWAGCTMHTHWSRG